MSLLHIAAYFDILELAQVLSLREDFKARVDKKNIECLKPVFIATERGSPRTLVFLLDCGADQTSTLGGENLFQLACRKGQLGLVRILIARGANVNEYLQENLAMRGTQAALRHAPKRLLDYFVKIGKQEDRDTEELVYVNSGSNVPPLHCALTAGHEEVARLLLDHGADIHHRTTMGWTVMHFAAWSGQVNLVQLISQRTGNSFPLSSDGWSPLHSAAWRGKTGAGECLLDQGIGVDLCTKDMQTALHLASFRGHHEMAKSLLRRGANPEAKTSKGMTPLHLAASEGNDDVVMVLLEHGVNRESTTNRGETALKIASGSKHSTTVQLLTTYKPAIVAHAPLPFASASGFGIPAINPASNPSPHGFTGQIQSPKPSYFNQNIAASSASPASAGPVLTMSPTGSLPLATSTPYPGNYIATSPGGFSMLQPNPAHGMNSASQTGYQQSNYPATSLASPVYSSPVASQQATFPRVTQAQATNLMPHSHLNIQAMQQPQFPSPTQQPVHGLPQHNAQQPHFSPTSPPAPASHSPLCSLAWQLPAISTPCQHSWELAASSTTTI
jgi:ankyrin repeat protein